MVIRILDRDFDRTETSNTRRGHCQPEVTEAGEPLPLSDSAERDRVKWFWRGYERDSLHFLWRHVCRILAYTTQLSHIISEHDHKDFTFTDKGFTQRITNCANWYILALFLYAKVLLWVLNAGSAGTIDQAGTKATAVKEHTGELELGLYKRIRRADHVKYVR